VSWFYKWVERFKEEANDFNAEHWYFAHLAKLIFDLPYRVWGKEPPKSTIQEWVLKFEIPDDKPESIDTRTAEEVLREHIQGSMEVWGGLADILKDAAKEEKELDQKREETAAKLAKLATVPTPAAPPKPKKKYPPKKK